MSSVPPRADGRGRVVYFGLYDPREAPGIHQKVMGVLSAARSAGFATRVWVEPFAKAASLRRLAAAIDASTESHLILRSQGWGNMLVSPALRRARRRGAVVIVDVPSPHRVGVIEVWRSPQSLWRRLRAVAAYYLAGPWPLWPATRIVQYAPEGWWFSAGNRGRTVEIGNGIDVASIAPRQSAPAWPAPRLQLIGVATIARWHGYDRLLRAIAEYHRRSNRTFDVHVTIVGDGPALGALRQQAIALGVNDSVTFTGTQAGEALRALYEASHLAVSTLCFHRNGLSRASELKAREYAAVGIPFMGCADDPDFPAEVPFRLRVANDDTTTDLIRIFETFDRHHARFDDGAERRYAEEHLDWRHKLPAFGLTP